MSVRVIASHVVGANSWTEWEVLEINKIFHDLAKKPEFYGKYHNLIDLQPGFQIF